MVDPMSWILRFQDVRTAIGVGAAITATSLMTDYECGLLRTIPMLMHLGLNALTGIVLSLAPRLRRRGRQPRGCRTSSSGSASSGRVSHFRLARSDLIDRGRR
jgi:hypothetical protein